MEKYWTVIEDHGGGEVFCTGVFKTLREAVGQAYIDIATFAESYDEEAGEQFSVSKLYADEYGGYFIEIEFKAACWDKPEKETYYILEGSNREGNNEPVDEN